MDGRLGGGHDEVRNIDRLGPNVMADKITFDLVSPERLLLSEQADMVTIPGSEGEMGVMAGHMPLITTLRPGVISVTGGAQANQNFVVLGGFAEVNHTKLTVLAEEAIPLAEFTAAVLEARVSQAAEDVALATTDAEKTARQAYLDGLRQLHPAA
jgi:F-type H+-transporting ATPase subunit epsilon